MNDIALLTRWRDNGDADAFRAIATTYAPMVYGTCLRILRNTAEAEDAAQESFITLARTRRLPKDHLAPWLYVLASNHARNHLRGNRRRLERETKFATQTIAPMSEPTWNEFSHIIDECLLVLPESLRVPLIGHFLLGKTHATVAAELGISRQAVANRLAKGIEKLRAILHKRGVTTTAGALSALLASNLAYATPATLAAKIGKLAMAGPVLTAAGTGVLVSGLISARAAAGLLLMTLIAMSASYLNLTTPEVSAGPTAATSTAKVSLSTTEVEPHTSEKVGPTSTPAATAPPLPEEPAARGPAVVTGQVFDTQGVPAPGAAIRLRTATNSMVPEAPVLDEREMVADGAGKFRFADLPVSNYLVAAHKENLFGTGFAVLTEQAPQLDIQVDLESGLPIGGTVVDSEGAPVPNATVVPHKLDGKPASRSLQETLLTRTDQEGKFYFPALRPEAWQLHCSAPGVGVTVTDPVQVKTLNTLVKLRRGNSIEGIVVDDTSGAPVPNMEVILSGEEAMPGGVALAKTSETGRFEFTSLWPGDYALFVKHEGMLLVAEKLPVKLARQDETVELRVTHGATIEGAVTFSASGQPSPRAEIIITREDMNYVQVAMADLKGKFSYGPLRPGRYRLWVNSVPSPDRAHASIDLAPGERLQNLAFKVPHSTAIFGRVRDVLGAPVAGASIQASTREQRFMFRTGVNGQFLLPNVEQDGQIILNAWDNHAYSGDVGPLPVSEIGEDGLDITLSENRTGLIEGVVLNPAGRPVTGQLTGMVSEGKNQYGFLGDRLDHEGRFLMHHMPPGEITLKFTVEGASKENDLHTLSLHPGEQVRALRLVYGSAADGQVAGVVRDPAGNPVRANLQLSAQGTFFSNNEEQIRSGEDGAFRFDSVAPGAYNLFAHTTAAPEAMGSLDGVQPGDEQLEVIVLPAATLSGKVVDVAGKPIANFSVGCQTETQGLVARLDRLQRVQDAEGRFRVEADMKTMALLLMMPAMPGMRVIPSNSVFNLFVHAEGYAMARIEVGELAPGDKVEDIVVTLERAEPVRGRVVDAEGNPVEGASLILDTGLIRNPESAGQPLTTTAADGTFELNLPSQETAPELFAYHTDLGTGRASVTGSTPLEIQLTPLGMLRGILLHNGVPAAGIEVYVASKSQATLEDGTFYFERLFTGEQEIRFAKPESTALNAGTREAKYSQTLVTIQPGEETYVELSY